jgi:release factor glutamine methyltransferase
MPVLDVSASDAGERVEAVVRRVARALSQAGVETPALDARRLVEAASGLTAAQLIAAPETVVAPDALDRLEAMVRRRCAREPVSRILGEREFYGRSFKVTPATLDPRPDSETLIAAALELGAELGWREREIRILDVGVGSGCLLVTLLCEYPRASGYGGDINRDALVVAADNARRHGVMNRAQFDMHDGLAGMNGPFDVLVCNPPYISTAEISDLSPEVRDHDPRPALDGGPDGLAVYRAILPGLSRVVVPGGWVLFEVGAGQADSVSRLICDTLPRARPPLRTWKDLGGHVRSVATEIQL